MSIEVNERIDPQIPSASSVTQTDDQGILSGLWAVYYRRGYEDGSRQVVRDLLESLVTISEDFLREQSATEQTRKLLYTFEALLERHIYRIADQSNYVEGGLGI